MLNCQENILSLLPPELQRSLFQIPLNNLEIQYCLMPNQDLMTSDFSSLSQQDRIRAWYLMVFSHSDLTYQQLHALFNHVQLLNWKHFIIPFIYLNRTSGLDLKQHYPLNPSDLYECAKLTIIHNQFDFFKYLLETNPRQQMYLISNDDYAFFHLAYKQPNTRFFEYILLINSEQKIAMICSQNFTLFSENIPQMTWCLDYLAIYQPQILNFLLQIHHHTIFFKGIASENYALLSWLKQHRKDLFEELFSYNQYHLFNIACQKAKTKLIFWCLLIAPEHQLTVLLQKQEQLFSHTSNEFHYQLLNWIKNNHPQVFSNKKFNLLNIAAKHGYLHLFEWLKKNAPEHFRPYIKKHFSTLVHLAAFQTKPNTLRYFMNIDGAQTEQIIAKNHFELFKICLQQEHLNVVSFMLSYISLQREEMLKAVFQDLYFKFPQKSHLFLINWFHAHDKKVLLAIFSSYGGEFLNHAISQNHIKVLDWLKIILPEITQDLLKKNIEENLCLAAFHGHLDIFKLIINLESQPGSLITCRNHLILKYALDKQYIEFLGWLMDNFIFQLAPRLSHEQFSWLRAQANKSDPRVIFCLLDFYPIFHMVERNPSLFPSDLMLNFIANKTLSGIQTEDINHNLVMLYLSMIRYLMTSRPTNYLRKIQQLLNIPFVANNAHLSINGLELNELFLRAQRLNDIDLMQMLCLFPNVRRLVDPETQSRIRQQAPSLLTIAHDHESSMTSLSFEQQHQLKQLSEHYAPIIKYRTASSIFEALKQELVERFYQDAPKLKNQHGQEFALPLYHHEFLKLDDEFKTQALNLYHSNEPHTAWRFLSIPNLWIDPQALYVKQSNENPTLKWAQFEDYIPLINLLFIAAFDQDMPCSDNHTHQTRIAMFIKGLSLAGRAHNWDRTRAKVITLGKTIYEEYDDGLPDQPSCYSGMKQYLFHSLHGHPMFSELNIEKLKQELLEFVRQQYEILIDDSNREIISNAWHEYIIELNPTAITILKSIDIPQANIQNFINDLKNKYQKNLNLNPNLFDFINNQLTISVQQSHFERFYTQAHLENILHIVNNSSRRP